MHADLLLLRVACNAVEEADADDNLIQQEQQQRILSSTHAVPHSHCDANTAPHHLLPPPTQLPMMARHDASQPMRRIPSAMPTHAADLVLGLRALATKPNPHKRARVESRAPAMDSPTKNEPHITLPTLVYANRSTLLPSFPMPTRKNESVVADDRSAMRAAPTTLVSFLGHKNKRGEERLPLASPNDATSPRSVWEDAHSDDASSHSSRSARDSTTLSPIGSPVTTANVHTTVSLLRVPSIPSLPSLSPTRRGDGNTISIQSSPLSIHEPTPAASLSKRVQPPTVTSSATQRPQFTRKTSAQWRLEMPAQDRHKTKDRIRRALTSQCDGDYEKLLLIVCAMQEEALHVHTTTAEHYAQQSVALRDRIDVLARCSSSSSLSFARAHV